MRIKYFFAQNHTPLYQGRALALRQCKGKYLAILDCDDLWLPNKLKIQVGEMEANPDAVICFSNTIFFNSITGVEKQVGFKGNFCRDISVENLKHHCFSLETILVRMSTLLEQRITFDERMNLIGDRDFLAAVTFYGDVIHIEQALGKWRRHDTNFSDRLKHRHAEELKLMYLNLKKRLGLRFSRKLRVQVLKEIAIRDAISDYEKPQVVEINKLRRVNLCSIKLIVLKLIFLLPRKYGLPLLDNLRRTNI